VVPVNPELVARRRRPARKNDDAADARIACLLALDRHAALKPLVPHGELAAELGAIARDDERAARDQTRLLNRLRADLAASFPAALTLAGDDLGARPCCGCWSAIPPPCWLARRATMTCWGRPASRHRQPGRFADKVATALAATTSPSPGAGAGQGRHHPTDRDPAAVDRRAAAGLGAADGWAAAGWTPPRPSPPAADQPGQAFPGGEIYLSFPGLGDRLAARVAGEIGDHPEQFRSPNTLACYAGTAPVTRRSGKRQFILARRLATTARLATPCTSGRSTA
jgi:Transposase IS116/IS110/IS902 family/Transposase